jgi:lipooligosaccharide transport system permease protein
MQASNKKNGNHMKKYENSAQAAAPAADYYPPLRHRLYSVWFRHVRVYTRHLFSNGFPPFIEPFIFLFGIGLGLGRYIDQKWAGLEFIEFLGTGLLMINAMWTSAFECSFGTFIRLEFEKVYDGMLAAPITARDLVIGEIIWAGTKGAFFSTAVLCVLSLFGVIPLPGGLMTPILGFLTGIMMGCFSLFITSFVKTVNHFNFYMTGVLSPMMFFSGVVFPITNLPAFLRPVSELIPLTHTVRLIRAFCTGEFKWSLLYSVAYIIIFIPVFGFFAVKRLSRRLIS